VWSGQITNRADLIMALSQGEGAREYYAEGRAAAEITRLWGAIERSIKAIRGSASASAPCTSRRRNNAAFFSGLIFSGLTKTRGVPRVFLFGRHCERSEAIRRAARRKKWICFAALAMTCGESAAYATIST
jgi:hypothetical protein